MLTRSHGQSLLALALTFVAAFVLLAIPQPSNPLSAQEAPAADAPAADPPPADAPAGDAEKPEKRSYLAWMVEASGWYGAVLLLLSFIMIALIMMNVLQVRRDILMPPEFIESFEQKITSKDYQGAYEVAKTDDSFIARVLTNGLGRLNRGYDEAIEGMQEVGEEENMTLEHRLSYVALIGAIAPMIGLMGTVHGMIDSFQTIAESPTSPKPSDLAEGISTALFTTLEGLVVAIPAMVGYGILRNRLAKLVLEVGIISESLMSKLPMVGRKPSGGAAAPAPAAPEK